MKKLLCLVALLFIPTIAFCVEPLGIKPRSDLSENLGNGTTRYNSINVKTVNSSVQNIYDATGTVLLSYMDAYKIVMGTNSTSSSLLPNCPFTIWSNLNSYSQCNMINISSGTSASSVWVVTGDNGTDSTYYFECGRNSSQYAQSGYETQPSSSAFVDNVGGSLILGAFANPSLSDTSQYIAFVTSSPASGNEKMRINANGTVSIGNTNNGNKLEVSGNIYCSSITCSLGNVITNSTSTWSKGAPASGIGSGFLGSGVVVSSITSGAYNNIIVSSFSSTGFSVSNSTITITNWLQWGRSGNTGSATATLGSNYPGATTTPNTWMGVMLSNGTTGYIPIWK